MPDSPSGGAAFLNGEEIVNDARTLSYLEAGYGPKRMTIEGGCACPNIRELIECGSSPYISPTADPAPWYDASIPESGDFAGFLTVDFDGMGSTYKRIVIDKITGGATLGRLTAGPRTLRWRGFLFGRSDCAVRYGLSWMAANLKGTNCSCTGEDLDLLVCCPEVSASPPVSGIDCDTPPVTPVACPPFTTPDAFRVLKNVGLLEGPIVLSERRIGCGNTECNDDDTVIIEIEFSLLAGNPYFYGCPVCLCTDQVFPAVGDCATDPLWVKYSDAEFAIILAAGLNPCLGSVCPPQVDCSADEVGCPKAELPVIPPFVDGCFCPPLAPVQICCDIPANSFGRFFEGAPVIEIYSGSGIMRSTTVRFYNNPQGLPCCDVSQNPCRNCDSVQIRYIPADSTLTIDGTTRTVLLQCPGQVDPILADHLTVTPFAWPLLQCVNFCICIETEGATVAPNATVSVVVVPREM